MLPKNPAVTPDSVLTTAEFLARLRSADVRIWADGAKVRCSAPEGILTPALQGELARRKAEILALLHESGSGLESTLPGLTRVPRQGDPPLAFAQRRLWFLDQLQAGTSAYTIGFRWRLRGQLDVKSLTNALTELVRRHEALRTTFASRNGEPVQRIGQAPRATLKTIRVGRVPAAERDQIAQRIVDDEVNRPFDLARGPLFRAVLIRFEPEEHELLVSAHHIVADGWSLAIIAEELAALYEGYLAGRPSSLPDPPLQYADFALWQHQRLQGEALDRDVRYWKRQLAGVPQLLNLPTDRPRPTMPGYRGARRAWSRSRGGWEGLTRLKKLAGDEGCTPFMALLAAFQALLARYTGQSDIVVGTPIAGRTRPEIERLVGSFVNTLALRTDVSGNPSFRDLLRRVRDVALSAYAHQDLPFEKLVEILQPRRDTSHSPIFQVMLAFQNVPAGHPDLSGLDVTPLDIGLGSAQFDITLHLYERWDGLTAVAEYDTELFDEWRIDQLMGHFHTMLEGIVEDPDCPIALLPLLTEAERERAPGGWTATTSDQAGGRCLHRFFEDRVAQSPNAVAVSSEGWTLTYAELNRRANQLAHHLARAGVGPEVLVGVCTDRSSEMIVALLAVLKAGGAYVPLDPGFPPERLKFMVEDGGVGVLLTQARLCNRVTVPGPRTICLDSDWEAIAQHPSDDLHTEVAPDNLMYVIYTSGSTGQPKGVEVTHRSVVNVLRALAADFALTERDVLVAVTTLSFDIAVLELLLPLMIGARVELVESTVAADGKALAALLPQVRATVMQATPTTWRMLVQAGWPGDPELQILCGGEMLSRELADQLLARGSKVWNLYGPTETTIWSTLHRVQPGTEPIPIGRPLANTETSVLDAHRQPVPTGVPGELHIGGVGLARGYRNRSDLTRERFVPHPFRADDVTYRTGDLVRMRPDGTLEFLGRLDDQVKVRGFRVELAEIEVTLRRHPAIAEAAVVVHESNADDGSLVAFVVPHDASSPSTEDLREFVRTKLPSYMVPSRISILDRLPITPNGKVDRRVLASQVVNGRSEDTGADPAGSPRRPMELALAAVWQELLGLERVGVYDNFFDIGGHSLLCMRVIARIEERFGVRLRPVDFMLQNLGQLATVCEERARLDRGRPGDGGVRRWLGALLRPLHR